MLVLHLFREHKSVAFIHKLLVTHFRDLCRDYECLRPLHDKLCKQKESEVYMMHGIECY